MTVDPIDPAGLPHSELPGNVGDVGDDGEARRQAVADSVMLLAKRWPAWCAQHGIAEPGQPVTQPAVLSRVGIDPDLQWVALIRFYVETSGRSWRGLVRGPVDDAVFAVRPVDNGLEQPGSVRWPRRRWWRRTVNDW